MRDKKDISAAIGLILLIWLSRLITIDHFPPFLDEALHVFFGEQSFHTSPIAFGSQGRLFTIWWYMIFQPHLGATFWVVRTATVLAVLPGAAAMIGIGRLKGGLWGALLAGLIYLFSTYHQFYDTLALSDTLSAAAVSVSVYMAYRLVQRNNNFDAILTGAAIFLAVGAKVSALVFFGIPLAAVLSLRPAGHSWRDQIRWLAIALVTGLGLTAVYAIGLRVFGYDLFALINAHNPNMTNQIVPRTFSNAGNTVNVIVGYVGVPAFIFLMVSLVILLIKRDYYLLLCLLAPLVVLWTGQEQTARFFIASVTLLLLCEATALIYIRVYLEQFLSRIRANSHAAQAINQYVANGIVLGVVVIWGAFQWLPFTNTIINDPVRLNLPKADYDEYVFSDASGFGLRETRTFLQSFPVHEVVGLLSNCQGLRYLALADFLVDCPPVNPNGEDVQPLADLLEKKRVGQDVYVVVESIPTVPHTIPGILLTVINRPADGPTLSIYRLNPPGE